VDLAAVEPEGGVEVAQSGAVDIGGHAGFIAQGEDMAAAAALEGGAGDFDVGAEGLLRAAGVPDSAQGSLSPFMIARYLRPSPVRESASKYW
jgi:hypothetical protein